jgi:endonuclease YncB( thermonuclease family)
MKHIILFLLSILGYSFTQSQTIIRLKDADTYVVLYNGKSITIRIENIDAPELEQYYGLQAKDSVSNLIYGKTVSIKIDGTDIYGRSLASITYNGHRLDSILVCKGWAWFYPKYSHDYQLSIYEDAAKAKSLGLWSCATSIPPWEWRRLNKRNKRLYEVCR